MTLSGSCIRCQTCLQNFNLEPMTKFLSFLLFLPSLKFQRCDSFIFLVFLSYATIADSYPSSIGFQHWTHHSVVKPQNFDLNFNSQYIHGFRRATRHLLQLQEVNELPSATGDILSQTSSIFRVPENIPDQPISTSNTVDHDGFLFQDSPTSFPTNENSGVRDMNGALTDSFVSKSLALFNTLGTYGYSQSPSEEGDSDSYGDAHIPVVHQDYLETKEEEKRQLERKMRQAGRQYQAAYEALSRFQQNYPTSNFTEVTATQNDNLSHSRGDKLRENKENLGSVNENRQKKAKSKVIKDSFELLDGNTRTLDPAEIVWNEMLARNSLSDDNDGSQIGQSILVSSDRVKRKEKCEAKKFMQTVRYPGCRDKLVSNKYCFGQCNTFYIPLVRQTDADMRLHGSVETSFTTCSSCRPWRSSKLKNVTLTCPGRVPTHQVVKVEKVFGCECRDETLPIVNIEMV